MPKISIIMATYNTDKTILKQSIDSILNQTYNNFEFIIIVDGDCEDIKIVKEYSDDRIKIIKNEKNMGLPTSLNIGIENSSGEYIARMDSDDIAISNRLEIQLNYMEKHKNIDISGMFVKTFGDEVKDIINSLYDFESIKCQIFYSTTLIHPSVMIRRKFLLDNNLKYNDHFKYSQDFDFWSRCSRFGNIAVIPKFGLNYRVHKNQISTAKKEQQLEYFKEILLNNLQLFYSEDESLKKLNSILILNGKIELNVDNYKELSDFIDELIQLNLKLKIFNFKKFKKNLYYRYFSLIVKNKQINKKEIFANKNIRKKIYNIDNLVIVLKSQLMKLKNKVW